MIVPPATATTRVMRLLPTLLQALLLGLLLSACDREAVATAAARVTAATPATPASARVDGLVVLAPGQSADLAAATTLRFERIVGDSRCPVGAQCIWEGEVTIALTLTAPAGRTALELSRARNRTSVRSFAIELVSFGRCPAASAGAALARECASLRVTAAR